MSARLKKRFQPGRNPALILTIANGAAHTRAADAIKQAIDSHSGRGSAVVVDVSEYMSWFARLTHVTLYLWLLRRAPLVWGLIDRYQKRQVHTSPEWYYRRGCRRLFELVASIVPGALVATEVGCCEVAALVKRELKLDVPLVAINVDHDADRAWIQPEVNLYCVATNDVRGQVISQGAAPEKVRVWGVPLDIAFYPSRRRIQERKAVCERLNLDPFLPVILVAGGAEGLGKIEQTVSRLLQMRPVRPQIVALTGNNERLRRRCEKLAGTREGERLRVLGWTNEIANLMRAADLLVSKTGIIFDEAIAAELPIVALEPPPGSERVKYRLLDRWGTGRAVRSLDEMYEAVLRLMLRPAELRDMRARCRRRQMPDAAAQVARWLGDDSRQSVFAYKPPRGRPITHGHAGTNLQTRIIDQPL